MSGSPPSSLSADVAIAANDATVGENSGTTATHRDSFLGTVPVATRAFTQISPVHRPHAEPHTDTDTLNDAYENRVSSERTAAQMAIEPTRYPSTRSTSTPASTVQTPTVSSASAGQAPSSAPPTSVLRDSRNNHDGLNVRITHPQPTGAGGTERPRVVDVNRTTGQLRLDVGGGNIVTIPLHNRRSLRQQARVQVTRVPMPSLNDPSNGPAITTNSDGRHQPGIANGILSNVNVRVSNLPLQTEPVPETSDTDRYPYNDESLARFKCTLCYEFMSEPVGCPSASCSSRFCRGCFMKSAEATLTSRNHRSNQLPRCPTCRVEYSYFVPDEALKAEMDQGPTASCRHDGCPRHDLLLKDIQQHEEQCPYQKVRCRYRSFGCQWQGPQGKVIVHEEQECVLAKVKVLIESFRRLELEHTNRLNILQQQSHGALHMMQVYRQNAQRDLLKSTSNIFDLFHYCHVVTCCTNHFLKTKDRWIPFYRSNEGRAAVTNFLILLPTVLTCGMSFLRGVDSLLKLCFIEHSDPSISSDSSTTTAKPFHFLLEDSVFGILLGTLMALMLAANLLDTKSSVTWGKFPLPGFGSPPVMCDIVAVTLFTMHYGLLEVQGAAGKSMVVWWILAVASTFYPAIVLSISHDAANGLTSTPAPTIANVFSKARSMEPMLFGLRFCLVGTLFGILPTLDAAALNVMLQRILKQEQPADGTSHSATRMWSISLFQIKNCFFDSLPQSFVLAYLGAKIAMESVHYKHWKEGFDWKDDVDWKDRVTNLFSSESLIWSTVDSVLAFVLFLICSMLLNSLLHLGFQVGQSVVKAAGASNASQNQPDGSSAPTHDYQLMGLTAFGFWLLLLCILVYAC